MPTWNALFRAHCERLGLNQLAVSHALKVAPSRVHGWWHGAYPREKMRKRMDRWSGGAIPADAPAESDVLPRTGTDG